MYYRTVIRLQQCLNEADPERGVIYRFFAVDEISLMSNPVRMYRFIFHKADKVLENSDALAGIRNKFISSLFVCGIGSVLAGVDILLR
ncbi:hypothetical protein [Thiohalobacter sp. COW1]|uniref:hypothetical protein n=1 Tax=Thiohalobacter sp. COW1 TaxID=2795687 RepID=UPI001915C078|nr:hypothetical protein [Thiohalobacter sp. COW1]